MPAAHAHGIAVHPQCLAGQTPDAAVLVRLVTATSMAGFGELSETLALAPHPEYQMGPWRLSQTQARHVAIALDALGISVLMGAYAIMRWAEKVDNAAVQQLGITADRYTVRLDGVPAHATSRSLAKYMHRRFDVEVHTVYLVPQYRGLMDAAQARGKLLDSVEIVEMEMARMFFKHRSVLQSTLRIASVNTGFAQGGTAKSARNLGAWLAAKLQGLGGAAGSPEPGDVVSNHERSMPEPDKSYTLQLWKQREALLDAAAEFQHRMKSAMHLEGPVCAFAVLETQSGKRRVEAALHPSCWAQCCMKKSLRYRGESVLRATPAPPPSTVLWENLGVSSLERWVRASMGALLSAALISASVWVILETAQAAAGPGAATLGIPLVIVWVNVLLEGALRSMVYAERPASIDDVERTIVRRLGVRLFINTALTIIAVNVGLAWERVELGMAWVHSVGVSLAVAMAYDAVLQFSPQLVQGIMPCWARCRMRMNCCASARAIPGLVSALVGSEYPMAENLARNINTAYVCFIFSPVLPVLLPICMASIAASYWVDKFWLLRMSKVPPHYGPRVSGQASQSIAGAIAARAAVSVWMLSGPIFQLGTGRPIDAQFPSLQKSASDSWPWYVQVADRFLEQHLYLHLVLLLAATLLAARDLVLAPIWQATCAKLECCALCRESADMLAARTRSSGQTLADIKLVHARAARMRYSEAAEGNFWTGGLSSYHIAENATYSAAFATLEEHMEARQADLAFLGARAAGPDEGFLRRDRLWAQGERREQRGVRGLRNRMRKTGKVAPAAGAAAQRRPRVTPHTASVRHNVDMSSSSSPESSDMEGQIRHLDRKLSKGRSNWGLGVSMKYFASSVRGLRQKAAQRTVRAYANATGQTPEQLLAQGAQR